jgi:hypothetical protein
MGGQPGMPKQRPLGITIIAILSAIGAIFLLLGGLALVALSGFVGVAVGSGLLAGLGGVIGGVLVILGLLYFVIAYGFWSGKGWAWTLGVALMVISIIVNLAAVAGIGSTGSIVDIIINLVILYYLFRPHVKAFFGKGSVMM